MMFYSANNDPLKRLHHRLVSSCGIVEIGCYDVLFGRRIRAGFVADQTCVIDWCMGDDVVRFWSYYTALTLLLRRREEDHDCFRGIPECSIIKPCFNDPVFTQTITDLMMEDPNVTETC